MTKIFLILSYVFYGYPCIYTAWTLVCIVYVPIWLVGCFMPGFMPEALAATVRAVELLLLLQSIIHLLLYFSAAYRHLNRITKWGFTFVCTRHFSLHNFVFHMQLWVL